MILSLCELVVGGKEGLLPVEKTVIDRCVHLIYRKYFADPCPENMPILEDLYNALLQQDEKEAHHVATALEIYVHPHAADVRGWHLPGEAELLYSDDCLSGYQLSVGAAGG